MYLKVFLAGLGTAICLTGCGGVANSGTSTPESPELTLSATTVAFVNTTEGQASASQMVTLTNTGNAALTLTSATLSDKTDYAMTSTCGQSLAASANCALTVTFTPQSAASLPASIELVDNASNSPQTINLTGTGTAPPVPQALLMPSSLTFATSVNTAAGAQTVTLSNPGNATLTGIGISIGGGTAPAAFSETTTCGSTLAAGGNCGISVNFTPQTSGTLTATLSVTDNASGSPQEVSLSGTATAPQAMLTSSSMNFPTTKEGTQSAAMSVTLTNSGNATLNIASIVLGGANASDFSETTTCGATLAANADCTISATFTPAAASSYGATIAVTDNASGSPQTISLSGTGTASSVAYTFYVFPEADNKVTPLYALINNAQTSIDMTMYALEDTTFSGDLAAACNRGVTVRVILDQNDEKSGNTPAFNQLNAVNHCSAVWANKAFEATHEKSFIIDGAQVAIMSLNLQSQYYSTTRDFAMLENDATDIAAIEATFNADYAAGTTSTGTAGASDFSYQPGAGYDLIWSPTTAQADMLGLINNAQATLLVENEEMGASNIVSALESACRRGVTVHIAMVSDSSYDSNFAALLSAGCFVNLYPDTETGFYIHAKAVVADYGLSTQNVYMGSINYSNASMDNNRELGMYISDPASVETLNTTMSADYAGGTPY